MPNALPTVPVLSTPTIGNATLSYTFSSVSGETYSASCTEANSTTGVVVGTATVITSNGTGTVSVAGLTNGIAYSCTVTAKNSGGSKVSATVVGIPNLPPDVPTFRLKAVGDGFLTYEFKRSTGIVYTTNCRNTDAPTNYATVINGDSFSARSLTNGKTYTCSLKATNSAGSAISADVVGIPNKAPETPTLSVAVASGQLNYSFNRADGVTYTASCVNNYGTEISDKEFSVSGLTNGISYSCTLRAANSGGSATSVPASATPITVPDALTQSKIVISQSSTCVNGKLQATISYEAPASNGGNAINGYKLSWNVNGSSSITAENPATATSFTVLLPTGQGATFSATITATNDAGSSAGTTKTATTVFCSTPDTPV